MEDKIKALIFSLKFMFASFSKKLLATSHEYLAGVNSQGGSTGVGVGVKNHRDPSLCRSSGEGSTGDLEHFFHEHFGNLDVEEGAGWVGEAQVSCPHPVKISQISFWCQLGIPDIECVTSHP